jgi:hypothetical protein
MLFLQFKLISLASTHLLGLNVIGVAVGNAAITLTIKQHSSEIEHYVAEHQEYIKQDLVDAGGVIVGIGGMAIGASIATTGGLVILAASGVYTMIAMGELIVSVKEHYLPQEYWKYISYKRGGWLSGYECEAFIGEDNCIHYRQIPKNPDGTLRRNETIVI